MSPKADSAPAVCDQCHAVSGATVMAGGVPQPEVHTFKDNGQPCSLYRQVA